MEIAVTITRTESVTLYFGTSLEDDHDIYETIDEHIKTIEKSAENWHRIDFEWDTEILTTKAPTTCRNLDELISEGIL